MTWIQACYPERYVLSRLRSLINEDSHRMKMFLFLSLNFSNSILREFVLRHCLVNIKASNQMSLKLPILTVAGLKALWLQRHPKHSKIRSTRLLRTEVDSVWMNYESFRIQKKSIATSFKSKDFRLFNFKILSLQLERDTSCGFRLFLQ